MTFRDILFIWRTIITSEKRVEFRHVSSPKNNFFTIDADMLKLCSPSVHPQIEVLKGIDMLKWILSVHGVVQIGKP